MNEFKSFSFNSLDEVMPAYMLISDIIVSFNGNAERFYPEFYKSLSDFVFKNLSQNCSVLLSFEVANHVLAHISGAFFKDEVITFKYSETEFSEKEKSIIPYLSGYVMYLVHFIAGFGFQNHRIPSVLIINNAYHFFLQVNVQEKILPLQNTSTLIYLTVVVCGRSMKMLSVYLT